MSSLRIKGVVAFANRVRSEMTAPLSAERRKDLRFQIDDTLRQIERIVLKHSSSIERLPTPTFRAYEFLKGLDLNAFRGALASAADPGRGRRPKSLRLNGAKSSWERLLSELSLANSPAEFELRHAEIRGMRRGIEVCLDTDRIKPSELTPQSRDVWDWLTFFQEELHFTEYIEAIKRARPMIEAALVHDRRFPSPALIEFRPRRPLYRFRKARKGTKVVLPVAMIVFTAEEFAQLAAVAMGVEGTDKQDLFDATTSSAYQAMQGKIEGILGSIDQTAGAHRNLRDSFDDVNERYFGGEMALPNLTWSPSFTGSKFGHYDYSNDTVMISSTLDRLDIPSYVLEFVIYHELLHKELGVQWTNGQARVHTPEFRRRERLFQQIDSCDTIFQNIANGRQPVPGARQEREEGC